MTRRSPALALWLLYLVSLACAQRPDVEAGSSSGDTQIAGVLQVTSEQAYLEHDGKRVSLIQAAPQTASSHTTLMAETATTLRPLHGKRVRARGNLQGSILWSAEVVSSGRAP